MIYLVSKWVWVGVGALIAAGAALGGFVLLRHQEPPAVAATVVAAPAGEAGVAAARPGAKGQSLLETIAKAGGSVQLVVTDGQSEIAASAVDLTPRDTAGQPLHYEPMLSDTARANAAQAAAEAPSGSSGQRSWLAQLASAASRAPNTTILYTPLISTIDPIDMGVTTPGSVKPSKVVGHLREAHSVPTLRGVSVLVEVLPFTTTSEQQPLDVASRKWAEAVIIGTIRAGGGRVIGIENAVAGPDGRGTPAPIVPITAVSSLPPGRPPGCRLDGALFPPNSPRMLLTASLRADLLACAAKARPGARIVVTGHTNFAGGLALSRSRAEAVGSWLRTEAGLPRDSITTRGVANHDPKPGPAGSPAQRFVDVEITNK